MSKRRAVLLGMASAVPAGFLAGKQVSAASLASPKAEKQARNIFRELGVRTFINAAGPYSILSGAQMWPEVIQAMHHAKLHKARMGELHDAVGKRIAELTGAEAAMVGLLVLDGVPLEIALPATLVIRVTTLWFAILIGLVIFPIAEHSSKKAQDALETN